MKVSRQDFTDPKWRCWLSGERLEQARRIKSGKQQQIYLGAEVLLNRSLERIGAGLSLPAVYTRTVHGKPYLYGQKGLYVNWSHSKDCVLCGLSDQEIGVDIERIRPVGQRMMVRLAHVSTEEAFFQNWVRREARAKRSGNGVGTIMRSESPLQPGEYYYPLDTFPGYAAGVATRSKELPGKLHRYSLDDML